MATETRKEEESRSPVKFWEKQLELADREERDWRKKAQDVVDKYRSEKASSRQRFNILWSNTETLSAALGAEDPVPDVRRRFKQADAPSRQVADVLERAMSYSADASYDLMAEVEAARLDMLLPGRAVLRVIYDPTLGRRVEPINDAFGAQMVGDDGQPMEQEVEFMVDQEVRLEHVDWEDYRQAPSKSQKKVWWRAFRLEMTRDELTEEFGDVGSKVPLNRTPKDEDKNPDISLGMAEVWEIWDRSTRKVRFLVKGFPQLLAERDDPLSLRGFFPCPAPLYGVMTPGTEVPVPEYVLYEALAMEANRLTQRIAHMVEGIKRRGAYDAQFKEVLEQLAKGGDNFFVGVDSWQALQDKGGLAGVFASEDISQAISAVQVLMQERAAVIQQIFEITGISDIIRGRTDPRETATAQGIKAQFGSLRLQQRQRSYNRMLRDAFRLKAEVIAENFTPTILQQITGIEVTSDMIRIMRDDKLRGYKIDVETEQTAFQDDAEERKSRLDYLAAMIDMLEKLIPASQAIPELGKVAAEFALFGARTFKAGRQMEETIEEAFQQLQNRPQQQQQPDPAMEKVKADAQIAQAELQQKGQIAQAELAMKAQQGQIEAATDAQLAQMKMEIDAALEARKQDIGARTVN